MTERFYILIRVIVTQVCVCQNSPICSLSSVYFVYKPQDNLSQDTDKRKNTAHLKTSLNLKLCNLI